MCIAIDIKCDCKIAWMLYSNDCLGLCKLWGTVCTEMYLDLRLIISDPKYEGKWNYVEMTHAEKK